MTETAYSWIESTSWELPFFGLPTRIPWPSDISPDVANSDPFEIEHMLRAIDSMGADAGDPWVHFALAANVLDELAESLEDSEVVRARELLEEFERLHPGTAFARYHLGMVARLEGREEDALQHYREAAEKTPRVAAIWNNVGILLAMRGAREEAIEAFRKVLEIAPGDRTALEGLAQLRVLVKLMRDPKDPSSAAFVDMPQFRQMVAQQLQQLANDPDQMLSRGEQLLRDGLVPDIGLQALQRALQLRPDHPRTLLAMAAAWRMAGQFDQARQAITRYTELHPEDPQGYFHLAQICNAAGDGEGERVALDKVLELDPNVQPALGLRFQLSPTEHDPGKEDALGRFGEERRSWMAFVLASELARRRGDAKTAVRWAERAYAIDPEAEDVILHYTAAIGDARDFAKLAKVIKPKLESGQYSKRVDWNYAQVLQQLGLVKEAIAVLRKAASAPDAAADFKANAALAIDAWSGLVTGAGLPLEVHSSGFLVRPVIVSLSDGDGGVVVNAGAALPSEGSFPWRADGVEARVALQQGQTGSSLAPRALGTFLIRDIRPAAERATTIECHVSALPDGRLHFRARQDQRKLPVGWIPAAGSR
ncbi:MAG TPA: tetratricopeptide repeat protein [Chthoniobacteraceae bacterium]|jgi:tetratricopeptide (TPR) repeat protein